MCVCVRNGSGEKVKQSRKSVRLADAKAYGREMGQVRNYLLAN